jgi:hypothetical protein
MTAYQQLKQASRDVGWPLSFPTDLTSHDRARLQGDDAPATFGWVLRECGTLIIDPRIGRNTLNGFLAHLCSNGQRDLFFWWDGSKLHSLSFEHFSVELRQQNKPSGDLRHNSY